MKLLFEIILVIFCLFGIIRLIKSKFTLNKPSFVVWIILVVFVILTIITLKFDQIILNLFNKLSYKIFKTFSRLGDGLILYSIVVFISWIFYIFKLEEIELKILRALPAGIFAGISSQILKHIFLRARPYITKDPYNFFNFPMFFKSFNGNSDFISMPSGHTAVSFAVFTLLFFSFKRKFSLYHLIIIIPAILIGVSRIVLNQHWPSDVMAGAGLGLFFGILFKDKS